MKLQEYLDKKLSEDEKQQVITTVDEYFVASQEKMRKHHREWYLIDRFLDGDHWVVFNKLTNSIQSLPVSSGEIRRTINLADTQIRSVKNFITKNAVRMEVHPRGDVSKEKAEVGHDIAQYYYETCRLKMAQDDIVDEALKHFIGYFVIGLGDTNRDNIPDITVAVRSSYDIYPSPESTDITIEKCRYVFDTRSEYIDDIKDNKEYDLINKDTKFESETDTNVSEYKAKLDRDRETKQPQKSKDLDKITVKDLYFRYRDDTKWKVGQITAAGKQILKIKKLNTKDYPIVPYRTERKIDQLISKPWVKNIISPNKAADKMCSHIETYILRMLNGKILMKENTTMSRFTDKQGEIIKWKGGTAPENWRLEPLPSTPFEYLKYLLRFIEDMGGVHPASLGALPGANQSGRSIEALQAADASNVADPVKNLAYTMTELLYRIFDVLSANTLLEATIKVIDGDKKEKEVKFIGGQPLKESPEVKQIYEQGKTMIIEDMDVKVEIVPELAYTEAGRYDKLIELADKKIIPPEVILEELRFSNVGDIIKKLNQQKRLEGFAKGNERPMVDPIELANQENNTMGNNQEVQPTPIELVVPEHHNLHIIFLKQLDPKSQGAQLLTAHINQEASGL